MKKSLLLTTAALCTMAMSAQDYTPANWKFADMPLGSAKSIFCEEGASLAWNLSGPFTNWYIDGANGGIVACLGHDGGVNNFASMNDEQKAQFTQFYESATIVDGGEENLLCFIGPNATREEATYPGATKYGAVDGHVILFWMSGNDIPKDSYYRLTYEFRTVVDKDYAECFKMEIGNASWNGIDEGDNNPLHAAPWNMSGYRTVSVPAYESFPDVWYKVCVDFWVRDTKDDANPTLPMTIKMNMGGAFPTSMFLFRQPKLEKIETPNADYVNGGQNITASDFTDTPGGGSGVTGLAAGNDVIVAAANGNITVIDANAPVEVYNMAGAKVASVAAPSTVETISLDMNGVFVVKVGEKVQKVIL